MPTFRDEVDERERSASLPSDGRTSGCSRSSDSHVTWIGRKYAEASGLARPPALSYSRDALPPPQPKPNRETLHTARNVRRLLKALDTSGLAAALG